METTRGGADAKARLDCPRDRPAASFPALSFAMKTVTATRYVTPLREGGSLPAIVEADDCGLYVVKFRAAGHGVRALIAELVGGELARATGLRVPELVRIHVDAALGRNEPDAEIRDLLRGSVGLNVGLDYLPGSFSYDPAASPAIPADEASAIVWFDAFTTNVDRTARNPNLLWWHRRLWLIDHGSALYFHHAWGDATAQSRTPFAPIRDHVLLAEATAIAAAGARIAPRLTPAAIEAVLAEVPDEWLSGEPRFPSPDAHRAAYAEYLTRRLEASSLFEKEAERARATLV